MPGTNYFSFFPQMSYEGADKNKKTVVDIFKRAKIVNLDKIVKSSVFYTYTIQDGERPEHIAERYYGDTQYYWLILYANDIVNIYAQWPRSYREFENYIISKYGSLELAQSTLHHYEREDGEWTIGVTYTDLDEIKESTAISVFDYEYQLNEDKKEISIIKSDYLKQIINEMNKIFKG